MSEVGGLGVGVSVTVGWGTGVGIVGFSVGEEDGVAVCIGIGFRETVGVGDGVRMGKWIGESIVGDGERNAEGVGRVLCAKTRCPQRLGD